MMSTSLVLNSFVTHRHPRDGGTKLPSRRETCPPMPMASPMSILPASPSPSRLARGCRSNSSAIALGRTTTLPLPSSLDRRCQVSDSHNMTMTTTTATATHFPFSSTSHLTPGKRGQWAPFLVKASVGDIPPVVEPETSVAFEQNLIIPGCEDPVVLLGIGYREKVFAIVGAKVYAAAFYVEYSLLDTLQSWKGKSASEMSGDPSLFKHIFKVSPKKTLNIVLVRNVDGKTFWNALNDVISPRIKKPTAKDASALRTFRIAFESRSLTKGSIVYLTWDGSSKMLVSISSKGGPSAVDAVIQSENVPFALYDAYFCDKPVSPTLKASVTSGLSQIAKTL